MSQLVFVKKDVVVTDSLMVAHAFEKSHDKVLRDIRDLGCSEEFRLANFGESTYTNAQGRQMPKYIITEQGFALLAMGYTGKKAMMFKEKYITEFHRMRESLREKLSSDWKETRIKGKLARRNETDVIMTKLIPLAISQGSKNAEKLYMTYSKLVNECVGIPSKSRDKATQRVLDVIFNLENLIENVIAEEAEKGTYYKDIYQICKGKCRLLTELSYLPKQKMLAG